jgi:hypothetical protein
MTKKQPADQLGFSDRAKIYGSAAAQQAVPLARNAGTNVKQGRDVFIAWATPYVGAARHWAAPRLEQSAVALNETIAPTISDALISAAHKIDYVEPKQRRIGRNSLFTGSMLLIAAGCAMAFTLLRRQDMAAGFTAATPAPDVPQPAPAPDASQSGYAQEDPGMPDSGGQPPMG